MSWQVVVVILLSMALVAGGFMVFVLLQRKDEKYSELQKKYMNALNQISQYRDHLKSLVESEANRELSDEKALNKLRGNIARAGNSTNKKSFKR